MKLRIQNDSVRLRVTVSETRLIGEGVTVTCRTRFPGGGTFSYSLEPADVACMDARLEVSALVVRVPRGEALQWARQAEAVAMHARVRVEERPSDLRPPRSLEEKRSSPEAALDLLVEKDFACVAPRAGEDAADLLVNPAATPPV